MMKRLFTAQMKKSRISYFLLVAVMLLSTSVPMMAEEEDEHYWIDDILYTINEDSTSVTVISCSDDMEVLIIPTTVEINGVNYRVTDIGAWAFEDNRDLEYVDTGDGVERIGVGAFENVSYQFDSIVIGKSVKYIGTDAFHYNHLEKVIIKDLTAWCNIEFGNYRANPLYLNKKLILNGEEITDLVIPEGVTEIKNNAFAGGAFTSVTIPEGVTRIGDYAFCDCHSLNTPLVLPNSLTTVDYQAFYYCLALPEVYFGDSIASIGDYAFNHCPLTKVHITNLAGWCGVEFRYEPPQQIARHLYLGDEEIIDLVIPEGVESISRKAFNNCLSFKSITVPTSLTTLGTDVFDNSTNVERLYWNAVNCTTNGALEAGNITEVTFGDQVEYIPLALLKNAKITSLAVPPSVREIGNNAFEGCSRLTDVSMGDSLLVLGANAFKNCSALTAIDIPDAVTTVGEKAFSGCSKLNTLTIGRGVKVINGYATENCTNLKHIIYNAIDATLYYFYPTVMEELTIGEGVRTIPEDLAYSSKIKSVTMPNSVTSIGEQAFYRCHELKTVNLSDSLCSIAPLAFAQCEKIESITLPKTLTSLGYSAFNGCSGLKTVKLSPELTSIESSVFGNCSSLTGVTIPPKVRSIGYEAFYKCSGLTYITLPDSLTQMGVSAFHYCSGLEHILSYINNPSQCDVYGSWRFEGIDKENCVLHVPKGTAAAYRAENGWKDFIHIVEENYPQPGDINGDGEINISDANSVIDIIVNGGNGGHGRVPSSDGEYYYFGDVNGDGEINIADVNAVIHIILKN